MSEQREDCIVDIDLAKNETNRMRVCNTEELKGISNPCV